MTITPNRLSCGRAWILAMAGLALLSLPAAATQWSSFRVTSEIRNLHMTHEGLAIDAANYNAWCAAGDYDGAYEVGFSDSPSAGLANAIVLQYTETAANNWGLSKGDYLLVEGLGGVYLVEGPAHADAGIKNSVATAVVNAYTAPGVAPTFSDWELVQDTGYTGFAKEANGYPSGANFLWYTPHYSTGYVKGRTVTATFALTDARIPLFLGLEVFGAKAVRNADGTFSQAPGTTGSTGWIRVSDWGQVVPEGSSLALLGGGLAPLLGALRLVRNRRRSG